jgi:large subunit ribosomal protein L11
MQPGKEISGIITLKHVFEIAKFIHDQNAFAHMELQHVCVSVIKKARQAGIKVIKEDLNPEEYKKFIAERKAIDDAQLKEIAEKRAAKLMRAVATQPGTTPAGATPTKK